MKRQQRSAAVAPLALLAMAVAACSRPLPADGGTPVVYTAVQRARTDPSANLTWAFAVDVDARGNVYVGDQSAVRVFAPDGTLRRSIGRQGAGPGEFVGIASVAVMPGDSLFVFDMEMNRVTVLEPGTGRAAYTIRAGRDQTFPPEKVVRVHGGRALSAVFRPAFMLDNPQREGTRRELVVVRLLNPDGSLRRDSVLTVRERENLVYRRAVGANPFGRETFLAWTRGDRIVAAWSDSLKFDVYSVEGRHLKTIRAAYQPPRRLITAAERDSVVQALSSPGHPPAEIRRVLNAYGGVTWPLLRQMVVDDHDRIWVGINGGRGEPVHWTAFDQRGARVAQVDLPANMLLRVMRGTTAYVAALDENDVPSVLTYDLKPAQALAMRRR
ncbi:MAG TPA: hypothetical protein VFJ16_19200 [Longimicrobium sp.]|nr:hypothetical protein [Longimicrobium sp.]